MRPADASDADYLELEVGDDGTVRALRRWFVMKDTGEVVMAANRTWSNGVPNVADIESADTVDTVVVEVDAELGGNTIIGPAISPRPPAKVT